MFKKKNGPNPDSPLGKLAQTRRSLYLTVGVLATVGGIYRLKLGLLYPFPGPSWQMLKEGTPKVEGVVFVCL